ncbi:integrase, catalytic region (plasmid) [Rickettsia endosymbiont of Ixodes scapularis]|nr:integrase, catalytic region [Rickettsia endosymbiont of Ixodes scapularis]
MSGKRITHQQAKVYMTLRKAGLKPSISSAKAGFSERIA